MSNSNLIQNSSYSAIKSLSKNGKLSNSEEQKVDWMISNMKENKAFSYLSENMGDLQKNEFIIDLKKRYLNYRKNWHDQPKYCVENKIYGEKLKSKNIVPLCIDIELASLCDLACPHCFRQTVATPDKIMKKDLAINLIDQASELNVPSMKFNWRGEPLLNPNIHKIINHAKRKGILETIINTNATMLNEEMSIKLINSGLDLLIYSFDGGKKKSYEAMRPGRFKENKFETIIENIKTFSRIKKEMNSNFPRTKIQMVLTKDTRLEQKEFFNLFKDIVDDISVKQYSERGGKIKDIDDKIKSRIKNSHQNKINSIDGDSEILLDLDNTIFISEGRLPCEQPFQRLQITYDGSTSMCCYDWSSSHPVGYVDKLALKLGIKEYDNILKKANKGAKGFELMNLSKVKLLNNADKKVSTISQIWNGKDINKVRETHINNKVANLEICKNCTFKDTYKWKKIT